VVVYHPGRIIFAGVKGRTIVNEGLDGASGLPGA
jgi:hypothetical protein